MNTSEPVARAGRPITRDREHLLTTAMHAYWHDERASVSINAICELAGVSKPSLYREFGSEDGLTAGVLDHYAQTVLASVEDLLSGPASLDQKLDALIDFACDDPRMAAGCLFVKMRAMRSRWGQQTQSRIAAIDATVLARFVQFFEQAALHGQCHTGVSPQLAASYLHEQFGLAFAQRAAGKDPASVRQLLVLALSVLRQDDGRA